MSRTELSSLGVGVAQNPVGGVISGAPGTIVVHNSSTPVTIYPTEGASSGNTLGTFTTDIYGRIPGWINSNQTVDITVPPAPVATAFIPSDSVALLNSPNAFTSTITINKQSPSSLPLAIRPVGGGAGTSQDHLLEITPGITAWGGTPLYFQNDGAFVTPSYITMNSGGWNGTSYASPAGSHSWLLALCNDLAGGQPNVISQIQRGAGPNPPGQHHMLCQDGTGALCFLLSGGEDNPLLGGGNNLSPTLWWARGAGADPFDTWLTRWQARTLGTESLALLGNNSTFDAKLLFGETTNGTRFSQWYDHGSGGLYIRDEIHGVTLISLSAAASGSIGFFGSFGAVQPVAGVGSNFTAGAGTTMNSASTSTGGTGSSAYTFADVIRGLKNVGLLAA